MNPHPIEAIVSRFLESHRIAITSHLRPDGDSLCTSLVLYEMGRQMGKDMAIYNKDATPFPFNHLPNVQAIQIGQIPPRTYETVILLECANVSRSGQINIDDIFKINIDHHFSNDYYADINWVDPNAAAVASMAFQLGERLGIEFTPQISDYLYCGIVSDTGSFQFSNTNARSFEVSYKLVNTGASPIRVSELLFNNNPPEKIKLLGKVLSRLLMNVEGNIATITMFKQDLSELNLKEIETEDITTLARSIKGIQMVLFFKEMEENTFRISLRSKGSANAALVAEHFGGGGHEHASGFTARGKYEDLIRRIPEEVNSLLKKQASH